MWTARYFPGLGYRPEDVDELLPERTAAMRKVGQRLLDTEERMRLEHTKGIMRSNGMRVR